MDHLIDDADRELELPPEGHPLHKLGARLTELLDEDQWAACERLLLEGWAQGPVDVTVSRECPECGSAETEWHCTQTTNSGVVDGRLRMHDVSTVFYLGCNHCSETIRTVSGDDVAQWMNTAANRGIPRD